MKVYACDICGVTVKKDPLIAYIREISFHEQKLGKKQKIHICARCVERMREDARREAEES